jgi:hypothetical protein
MLPAYVFVGGSGGPLETTIVLSGPVFVWLLLSFFASAGMLLLGLLHGKRRGRARTRTRRHLQLVAPPARSMGVRLEAWGLPLRVLRVCSAVPKGEAPERFPQPARG